MKVKLKKGTNAYSQGEIVYVAEKDYDVDARYGAELLVSGKFDEVKKEVKKEEEIK